MSTLAKEPLTDQERSELLQVAEMLETEPVNFDMRTACANDCGTTACIGGWLYLIRHYNGNVPHIVDANTVARANQFVNKEWFQNENEHSRLGRLFYERLDRDITRAQGAQAIRNFLECGDPKWDEIAPIEECDFDEEESI